MSTWNDYKSYVKSIDTENKKLIEEIEVMSSIINTMIKQRNEMGISQRDLAKMCNLPQSSIARIESHKTIPKLDTLIKIMQPLGLTLIVSK